MALLIAGALFLFGGLALLEEGANTLLAGSITLAGLALMIFGGAVLAI